MARPFEPRVVVALGVVFTSFSAILIRLATAPPLVIAAFRMVFAAGILVPWLLSGKARRKYRMTARDVGATLAAGLFLAVHFASWITSLSYTTVASATVLVNTQPIFLAAASALLFRERMRFVALLALAGALGGSALLALGDSGGGVSEARGDVLALIGAVSVAGYMVIGRFVRPRMGLVPYTSMVYGSAAVMLTIFALARGLSFFGHPATDYLLFLAMAVFCTLLGHSLMNWALRYINPTFIGTALLGEPVFASVMAWLIFSETPTTTTLLGGTVILACLFVFTRLETRRSSSRSRNATGR